jgi:hypothetical protein
LVVVSVLRLRLLVAWACAVVVIFTLVVVLLLLLAFLAAVLVAEGESLHLHPPLRVPPLLLPLRLCVNADLEHLLEVVQGLLPGGVELPERLELEEPGHLLADLLRVLVRVRHLADLGAVALVLRDFLPFGVGWVGREDMGGGEKGRKAWITSEPLRARSHHAAPQRHTHLLALLLAVRVRRVQGALSHRSRVGPGASRAEGEDGGF